MKYIMILIMCFPTLVLLYGASGEFYNGSIVIEFPNSLNPTVEDGVARRKGLQPLWQTELATPV